MSESPKRWLRKQAVARRYGVSTRTADRMVADGRLPPWRYLPNDLHPVQLESDLDAHDRRAALRPTAPVSEEITSA
jgi:hypothetical protein